MLFLCDLPTDVEPIDKEKPIKSGNNKIAMLIATMIGMLIIITIAGIMIAANNKTPQNVSPYCLFIKNEGKTCKIHNIKHEGGDLKELVVSESDMALHQKLFEEVSAGAYFDGKRLYKEEDAAEILAIYDTYQKEKEVLFEKYLEGSLDEERIQRYNSIIGELTDLEETIIKLNIERSDNNTRSKEDLIQEIEELKKELDEIKTAQLSTIVPLTVMQDKPQIESLNESQNAQQTEEKEQIGKNEQAREKDAPPLQEPKEDKKTESDKLLYVARSTKTIVIPADIEKAATIKKSSLYQ